MRRALWAIVSATAIYGGDTRALLDAVRGDDQPDVARLLKQGADPNGRESDGATPLAWAAMRTNTGIATILLEAGADPNLANELGIGPLALAITNGSSELVKLLLAHRANPNLARENGETPLMTATRLERSI